MFSWLRPDPTRALRRRYAALCKEAMMLQRQGKIPELARKTAEAEAVRAELEELERERTA